MSRRLKFSKAKRRKTTSQGDIVVPSNDQDDSEGDISNGVVQRVTISTSQTTPRGRKRKQVHSAEDPQDDPQADDELATVEFVRLQPHSKAIKTEVVKSDWTVSTRPSQLRIKGLFDWTQKISMISQRVENRQVEYQNTLTSLNKTLEKRLPRMPFPLGTKDWHFDYETILGANQDLEEQLTSTVHSTALLKAKLEQETRLLEQSKLELDKLRKNTKREEVLRAKRSKAADHTISRGGTLALKESLNRKRPSNTNASRATVLTRSKTLNRGISTNFPHPNFPLLDQLHGHIESIEANYSQTKLIGEMIDNAGAKLASSLCRYLESHESVDIPSVESTRLRYRSRTGSTAGWVPQIAAQELQAILECAARK